MTRNQAQLGAGQQNPGSPGGLFKTQVSGRVAGIHDAEEVALGVGEGDEAGAVGVCQGTRVAPREIKRATSACWSCA